MPPVKIIIFEDEFLLANDLKRQIVAFDYEVSAMFGKAEDGLAYLSKIDKKENIPDVVLMDISLAGSMNGIEAAEIISANYQCAVVFLSGINQPEIFDKCFSIKPRTFLLKPFDIYQALLTIKLAIYLNKLELRLIATQEETASNN
ncbi:MAG: response regulator [Bacteroidota bacterium]